MIRPRPLIGTIALVLALGGCAFWMTRRTPGAPPQDEILAPFKAQASGAGQLLELEPPPVPLRAVRWVGPLPGRAVVAQVLTQTGQQHVALFQDGKPGPVLSLPCPSNVPDNFFRFAELVDAVLIPGETVVLLYRGTNGADPALALAWDLPSGQMGWAHRAPGRHLALSPDRRSVFLFGGNGGVSILDPARQAAKAKAHTTLVELPPESGEISSLLPMGSRSFLATHRSGLSAWHHGAWTHVRAPAPSPLGFDRGLGILAGSAKTAWWQPEPGRLIPLDPDGVPGVPRNLKALLPDAAALDAELLRLLGTDPEGGLWFGLARPALPPPAPAQEVALAPPPPEAGAPAEAIGSALPAQPAPPSREAWETHLKLGLERIYRWPPGAETMTAMTWAEAWKNLAPPPGIPRPTGDGGLRPEAGALILGVPERMWWLPLKAVQPR